MASRIDMIRQLLAEKGDDTFLLYSLGMELSASGRHEEAIRQFDLCLKRDPGYLPAYAEAGKTLRALGRIPQAREMFQAGVVLAVRQDQAHMCDYLQQQIEGLPKSVGP